MDPGVLREITQMAKAMSEGDFYRDLSIRVTGELGKLAQYMNTTRKSLQHLDSSLVEAKAKIPKASAGLASITEATEEATHKILCLTEKILEDQSIAAGILARIRAGETTSDVLTRDIEELARIHEQNQADLIHILTNLSFQDITGQKMQKIIRLVEDVERRLLAIIVTFGIQEREEKAEQSLEMKAQILGKLEGQNKSVELSQNLVDEILSQWNGQRGGDSP